MTNRLRHALFAAALALPLGACSLWSDDGPETIETRAVAFAFASDLNDDYPLAVDLVLVHSETLIEPLAGMSAREWFAQREQVARDFPKGMRRYGFEVVPGQQLPPITLDGDDRDAYAIYVFAGYLAPGVHRARLDRLRAPVVEFGPRFVNVRGGR